MTSSAYLDEIRESAETALAKMEKAKGPGLTKEERRQLIEAANAELSTLPSKWWRLLPDGDEYFKRFEDAQSDD